jgi:hypothetical protein
LDAQKEIEGKEDRVAVVYVLGDMAFLEQDTVDLRT